jgi:hypothetical protein
VYIAQEAEEYWDEQGRKILLSSIFHACPSLKLEEEQKAKEREDQERERLFLQEQEQREIRDEQITKLR